MRLFCMGDAKWGNGWDQKDDLQWHWINLVNNHGITVTLRRQFDSFTDKKWSFEHNRMMLLHRDYYF